MTFPVLFLSPMLDRSAVVDAPQLIGTSERHKVDLGSPALVPLARSATAALGEVHGVVIEIWRGWPSYSQLALAKSALKQSKRAWLYWSKEGAVECLDADRLRTLRKLWLFMRVARATVLPVLKALTVLEWRIKEFKVRLKQHRIVAWLHAAPHRRVIRAVRDRVAPVPFSSVPAKGARIAGTGLYLRTDFWAPITSGGSYGHTCYVAKEIGRAHV